MLRTWSLLALMSLVRLPADVWDLKDIQLFLYPVTGMIPHLLLWKRSSMFQEIQSMYYYKYVCVKLKHEDSIILP